MVLLVTNITADFTLRKLPISDPQSAGIRLFNMTTELKYFDTSP